MTYGDGFAAMLRDHLVGRKIKDLDIKRVEALDIGYIGGTRAGLHGFLPWAMCEMGLVSKAKEFRKIKDARNAADYVLRSPPGRRFDREYAEEVIRDVLNLTAAIRAGPGP